MPRLVEVPREKGDTTGTSDDIENNNSALHIDPCNQAPKVNVEVTNKKCNERSPHTLKPDTHDDQKDSSPNDTGAATLPSASPTVNEHALISIETKKKNRKNDSDNTIIYFGPAPHLPTGWLMKRIKRTGGNREGRTDSFFYSETGKRFKSMVEVRRFLEIYTATGGDEKMAYKQIRSPAYKKKK